MSIKADPESIGRAVIWLEHAIGLYKCVVKSILESTNKRLAVLGTVFINTAKLSSVAGG